MRIGAGHLVAAVGAALTLGLILWPGSDAITGTRTVRMTVWGMPFEDRLFLDTYAKGYEREAPGVSVEYLRFADLKTKYNVWHAQGRGPEVMRIEMTWYHDFVRRGLVEPLGPRLNALPAGERDRILANIPPHLRQALDVGGEIYALPMDSAVLGLFYNKAIFDRYNEANPAAPLAYPDETWTWDDLRRAARLLTVREGQTLRQRGFDTAIWWWPFHTLYAQAGGRLWSEDGLWCLPDTRAGVRALELLRGMQADGSFAPSLGGYTDGAGADALFGSGRTAMMFDGSWRVPDFELRYPDLKFAVAPLPRGDRAAVVTGGVLWAMSTSAKRKDEAWDMLRWLVRDEQAAAYWNILRVAPPANLSVLRSPAFRSTAGVLKDPDHPEAGYAVPPMPESAYADKAAWLTRAFVPDETGHTPGFLPSHELQYDLDREIDNVLRRYLAPGSSESAERLLERAADAVHAVMDRSRAARGLPPVDRSGSPR